ncbi:MAG: basic amino acid ABC transporter substrate-binding protein [Ardenticatenales bacterium]
MARLASRRGSAAVIAALFGALLAACGDGSVYPPPVHNLPPATAYPAPGSADAGADAGGGAMSQGIVASLNGMALTIGTDATYPPMESTDTTGAIVGFDPDLMTAICNLVDCKPTFKGTAWDGIFAALSSGEFDALMSAISILPEREVSGKAKFTDPYYSVGQVILVKAANTTINGVGDLATATVGVQQGTTGDTAATEKAGVKDENVKRFDSNALAVQALKNGDVDAVVCDDPTAQRYVGSESGMFRIAGEPFTHEDYGILVPTDRRDVLAAFNAAIDTLKTDGTIDALLAKWKVGMPDDAAASGDAASGGAAASDAVTNTTGTTSTTGATAP